MIDLTLEKGITKNARKLTRAVKTFILMWEIKCFRGHLVLEVLLNSFTHTHPPHTYTQSPHKTKLEIDKVS